MSKKTNIDYLREIVKSNDEALEFLDAIENEFSELNDSLKESDAEAKKYDEKCSELELELDKKEDFINPHDLTKIDMAIGTIEYRCDNMALQSRIDDFMGELRREYVAL